MFAQLETQLLALVDTLPLEAFVFIASFVEEVISPIPSPTVMITAGAVAGMQGYTYGGIVLLALLGAVGKTLGGLLLYAIADKAEDIVVGKFGKFFGITSDDIEALGNKITGGPRDYAVLIFLRTLPIVQSGLLSVGCGLLKVPLRLYLIATLIGTIIKEGLYLYIGYTGAGALKAFMEGSTSLETVGTVLLALVIVIVFGYVYLRRRKRAGGTSEVG